MPASWITINFPSSVQHHCRGCYQVVVPPMFFYPGEADRAKFSWKASHVQRNCCVCEYSSLALQLRESFSDTSFVVSLLGAHVGSAAGPDAGSRGNEANPANKVSVHINTCSVLNVTRHLTFAGFHINWLAPFHACGAEENTALSGLLSHGTT